MLDLESANGGQAHTLAHGFTVFGYHVTGHTYTASSIGNGAGLANGTAAADPPGPDDSGPGPNGTPSDPAGGSRWNRLRPLGRRATSRQAASEVSSDGEAADEVREPQGDGPPADVPAGAPAE